MGLMKMLLGMKDNEVNGKLHVGTFQERFKESFGTEIRVYKAKADGTLNTGKGAKAAPAKASARNTHANTLSSAEVPAPKSRRCR